MVSIIIRSKTRANVFIWRGKLSLKAGEIRGRVFIRGKIETNFDCYVKSRIQTAKEKASNSRRATPE
jgi:hypothetical protein